MLKANKSLYSSFCDRSSDVETLYRKEYDKNGNAVYVVCGEQSTSEYINSFNKGATLQSVLERCSLLPTEEKLRYLQQVDVVGGNVDMRFMPKDGTEANIMISEMNRKYPDLVTQIRSGKSFEDVILSIFSKPTEKKPSESEVIEDGKN